MDARDPIGLFDSGVGGLSVLLEINKLLPDESTVFFADQKNIPYGKKSKKQLAEITTDITKFLLNQKIKALIVACNTATCYSLAELRLKFDIPIIGVVPAVKPAASLTKNARIVVMSTPATTTSQYLDELISEFAKDKTVLKLSCPNLEKAIENLDTVQIEKLLGKYSKNILDFDADVVVLGCTHYPIIKKRINHYLKPTIKVIDSGQSIANHTKNLLKKLKLLSRAKREEIYFTTGNPYAFSKISSQILKKEISAKHANL